MVLLSSFRIITSYFFIICGIPSCFFLRTVGLCPNSPFLYSLFISSTINSNKSYFCVILTSVRILSETYLDYSIRSTVLSKSDRTSIVEQVF